MPELPEVEHLRRTLEPRLVGRRVTDVTLRRRDVLRDHPPRRAYAARLLRGRRVARIVRHGKQLAIVCEAGAAVCVHLGMTGQLRWIPPGRRLTDASHVHCVWRCDDETHPVGPRNPLARLLFRDPRRFGGLWAFDHIDALLADRWSRLGPDALDADPATLAARLAGTSRSIKAALLDQHLIAGVGNIYADEALHAASVAPTTPTCRVPISAIETLCEALQAILSRAVDLGGSTFRNYRDSDGRAGGYAGSHQVYGRAGQNCRRCGATLTRCRNGRTAGRSTVYCPTCQVEY